MNSPLSSVGQTQIATIASPSPTVHLHCAIFVDVNTVVSDETFRLVKVTGQEGTSEPFEFQLELHGNTGNSGTTWTFDQLIGKPVTFGIALPIPEAEVAAALNPGKVSELGDWDDGFDSLLVSGQRFQAAIAKTAQQAAGASKSASKPTAVPGLSLFNGIVAAFSMSIPGVYSVTVRPSLWRLTLANRYTIYRNMTVKDAIEKVLDYHNLTAQTGALEELAVDRKQDWFQAGESDFDFLRRMMGKAHIYFYFNHGAREHQLVFANRPNYESVYPSGRPLRYTFSNTQEVSLGQNDLITDYRYQENLNTAAVQAVFTRQDEAWQVDGVPTLHQFQALPPAQQAGGELFLQHKVYQYGFNTEETIAFRNKTEQTRTNALSQLSGQSSCPLFRVGYQFSMTYQDSVDSELAPVQPCLNKRQFVLTKVEHEASLDGAYQNRFEAGDASTTIAPFSLADTQQGSVLAVVVAHGAGTVAPNDWRFFYLKNFDPQTMKYVDSLVPTDQTQGAYVQFATDPPGSAGVWVKLAANMQSVPEIGAQVIVSRANDESELPEIQNIVLADGTQVVTPGKWTANTHVGSSYGTRYGDGQNISFSTKPGPNLDKAKGIVTAAYNRGEFRDTSYGQGASYNLSTAESTAKDCAQDFSTTYGPHGPADDLLDVRESFGSSFGRSVGKVQSNNQTYDFNYSKSKYGQVESYQTVTGTSYSENYHDGKVTNYTKMTGGSKNTTIITGNSVNLNQIDVQSNSSAIGVSNSNDAIGLSNQNSATGASVHISVTGLSTQNTAVGAALNNSATGAVRENSAVGLSSSLSAKGTVSDISSVGTKTVVEMAGIMNSVTYSGGGTVLDSEATQAHIEMKGQKISLLTMTQLIM